MNDAAMPAPTRVRPRWLRALVLIVGLALAYGLTQTLTLTGVELAPLAALPLGLVATAALVLLYHGLVRWMEGRPAVELAVDRSTAGLGWGGLLGLGFMSVTVAAIALGGEVTFTRGGAISAVLGAVGFWIVVGVGEELLFRGAVFRLVEERVGSAWALAVSAVLFGAVHLANPDASLWGAVAIACEAGVMLGAAYLVTRSLWLPIGVHIAWNFAQGTLFGASVSGSGIDTGTVLTSTMEGPQWLTGGSFGPEASVVAVVLGAAMAAVMIVLARRRGNWRTRPRRAAVAEPAS
ncbi:type II CAAX endopeptidase family protein [Cellulomonas sp. NPDC089187]|uniref:CPBP family intramembrane glutamic endopeptidase n=1 Tax=Cellulomonas sp. NPDC089187 TaxID=3154970 RepID=UPI00343227FE